MVESCPGQPEVHMDDLRIWAVILAVIGIVCGVWLPTTILGVITVIVAVVVAYGLGVANSPGIHAPGTSGSYGATLFWILISMSLLLPMWGSWIIAR